jgi:single-strand DNA-binding protein
MLIGNVGSDPEVRSTASGTRLAKMSLATNRQWTNKDGSEQEKTEWHRLTVWGKLADVVERYVKKGDRLYVEGRIEYSESESDGQKKYWTDVNVLEMVMLGGQGGGAGGQGGGFAGGRGGRTGDGGSGGSAPEPPLTEPDDDLPF